MAPAGHPPFADLAVLHDEHAVAQRDGLLQAVGHQETAEPGCAARVRGGRRPPWRRRRGRAWGGRGSAPAAGADTATRQHDLLLVAAAQRPDRGRSARRADADRSIHSLASAASAPRMENGPRARPVRCRQEDVLGNRHPRAFPRCGARPGRSRYRRDRVRGERDAPGGRRGDARGHGSAPNRRGTAPPGRTPCTPAMPRTSPRALEVDVLEARGVSPVTPSTTSRARTPVPPRA